MSSVMKGSMVLYLLVFAGPQTKLGIEEYLLVHVDGLNVSTFP